MPKKTNRECKVCGGEYYYCPSCSAISAADKYKIMFCSENCRDIFKTLSRYNAGSINKIEAKEILSSLDLSKRDKFQGNIKEDVANIMKSYKAKSYKKVEKEEAIPAAPVEQNEVVIVDPVVAVEEPNIEVANFIEAPTPIVSIEF